MISTNILPRTEMFLFNKEEEMQDVGPRRDRVEQLHLTAPTVFMGLKRVEHTL